VIAGRFALGQAHAPRCCRRRFPERPDSARKRHSHSLPSAHSDRPRGKLADLNPKRPTTPAPSRAPPRRPA
jgi:hypothetical protein